MASRISLGVDTVGFCGIGGSNSVLQELALAPNSRFVIDKFRMALRSTHFAPQSER